MIYSPNTVVEIPIIWIWHH